MTFMCEDEHADDQFSTCIDVPNSVRIDIDLYRCGSKIRWQSQEQLHKDS